MITFLLTLGGAGLGALIGAGWIRYRGEERNRAWTERAVRSETALALSAEECVRTRAELREAMRSNAQLLADGAAKMAQLVEIRQAQQSERELLQRARSDLTQAFQALAGETLKGTAEQFYQMAHRSLVTLTERADGQLQQRERAVADLVLPLRESLDKLRLENQRMAELRASDHSSLRTQLLDISQSHQALSAETAKLVNALRTPHVRGRWGEIQLRRTAELAGMSQHCDFSEQSTVQSEGGIQRPDMVVHLPAGRQVVVDSKVPLLHYLEALEATTEEARVAALKSHARRVSTHIDQLASKTYWAQFDSVEFVVLFIPNDSFLAAAAEYDPELIESSLRQKVVLATPTTFIALLKAIAFGWRQEQMTKNSEQIAELGRELYQRLQLVADHLGTVGQQLGRTVESYNRAIGSLESRVLVTARKFQELDSGCEKPIPELPSIEDIPRQLN